MIPELTPEQKDRHLKTIAKIETMKRPEKWRAIRELLFELKPWLIPVEKDFIQACKELRQKNENKFAASNSGAMRNSMKLFLPVYESIIKLDPDFQVEASGKNKGDQELIGKQLYAAFPEYRVARIY